MDEKKPNLKKGDKLPYNDKVYRVVVSTVRDRKNKSIPAPRCFDLSEQDKNKLSVEWEIMTTPEETIARVGASYKYDKKEYKSYQNRELYAMELAFLNNLQDMDKTIYDPLIYPHPQKGRPNNPAHSLLVFHMDFLNDKARRPETIVKIRDHAKDKKICINEEKLDDLVKVYRNAQN